MHYRTRHLLDLKGFYNENDSLEKLVHLANTDLIDEVFRYESLSKSCTQNSKYREHKEKCKRYLKQLNYVRSLMSKNSFDLLKLEVCPNFEIVIFESKYPLQSILYINQMGIKRLISDDIFENCKPTEEINYFCFRNSLAPEIGIIEFSVANFGTLLVDIFENEKKIKIRTIRDSIISELDIETKLVDDLLVEFLKVNLIVNYSLLLNVN